ncbi:MAG: hypothetical protein EPO57_03215 [Chitinophagaceae bacterium]|nr:MAG: hypothetical protein EPO57_03215 [Chitinophagaceae bacterium]
MKKVVIIFFYVQFFCCFCCAQETPTSEEELENLVNSTQSETEDDSYTQQLEYYFKHPLNLNIATEKNLKEFQLLSGLQIANFLSYRKLLGKISSIYELQAIPAWDISTINKILPFVIVKEENKFFNKKEKQIFETPHSILLRLSQILEKSKGFNYFPTTGKKYLGSPQKIFLRYRFQNNKGIQYGFSGEKDAGEEFFRETQKQGFDFYSAHLFLRNVNNWNAIAIGDYTINMGQGLIQWQALSFGKSSEISSIKKQSSVLMPYNSAGEINFHRGVGATFRKNKIEATVFASIRKLSANFISDTVRNEDYVSSFLSSGYHRTESEMADRNKLNQLAMGGNIAYQSGFNHIGINGVAYQFSNPIKKKDEPYNLYAINGKTWSNFSVDYSYTYKNAHFFGEAAADKNFNKAILSGLLISVDKKVDLSFLYRNFSKQYQSIQGNAFSENTFPTNEKGFMAGIRIRPVPAWQIDAYVDLIKFPWLKYNVDAPSTAKDFLLQVKFNPNKKLEIYSRLRSQSKEQNQAGNTSATNYLVNIPQQNWRTQWSYKINTIWSIRNRAELLWYQIRTNNKEFGFSTFVDCIYKPRNKPWSGNARIQYFKTDSYNSRIYTYENDVLYYYGIPAFFDQGIRYYFNLTYDVSKNISVWMKWSQWHYQNKTTTGSGLDEINGSKKSELRLLVRVVF